MILDRQLVFSNAQAVTVTADSENVLDSKAAGDATEKELYLIVRVTNDADFAGGTSIATTLVTDDNASYTSAKTLISTGAIATATLVKKYTIIKQRIPLGMERYAKLVYTVVGTMSAGQIDAFLAESVDHDNTGVSL